MIKQLYRYLGYLNDALYYSLLWFFVGGMCTMSLMTEIMSFVDFVYIFALYFVCLFLQIKQVKYHKIGLFVVSVGLSYLCFHSYPIYAFLSGILYFYLGTLIFIMVGNRKMYLQDELKIILFALIYVASVCFFIQNTPLYFTISNLGIFFVMLSVVYLIRTNVIVEYEHYTNETIQKERNIVLVNLVSLAVGLFCFIIRGHIIDLLLVSFLAVIYLGYFFFKIVATVFAYIGNVVFYVFNFIPKAEMDESEAESLLDTTEQVLQEMTQEVVVADNTWFYVLAILFSIVVGYVIFRKLYRRFASYEANEDIIEEKEYIFDSSELFKGWKDKLSRLQAYANLSKVRKQYVKTVNKCIEEGFEWRSSFTPNEYLRSIDKKQVVQKYDFDKLTKAYNEERYGG